MEKAKPCNVIRRKIAKTTDNVNTPRYIYQPLNEMFDFDCDPCPFESKVDGLSKYFEWGDRNYVNPPYSNTKGWLMRGLEELLDHNKLSVFLIPFAFVTNYFEDYVFNPKERGEIIDVYLICSKITFSGYDAPLPVYLCFVVYGDNDKKMQEIKFYKTNGERLRIKHIY